MAMRETVRSMSAYFILVGLVAGGFAIANLRVLVQPTGDFLATWLRSILIISASLKVLVGVAFVIAGLTARHFFDKGDPRRIQQIILFSGVVYVLNGLLEAWLTWWFSQAGLNAYSAGYLTGKILFPLLLGVGITWYLYVNARRLARESIERRTRELGETFS